MNKELARRLQPRRDARKQQLVIPNVFEHLDRHHPVEAAIRGEGIHVGRHHLDIR